VFLVKDGRLLTPIARGEEPRGAMPAPVLPGVTRAAVIELAEGMGLPVEKRMLTIDDLLSADEVFLTNSGWQLLPVSSVEKQTIGQGGAGEVTRRMRAAVLELIERETGV
jgi:branched-chain amino acid aminotransferase